MKYSCLFSLGVAAMLAGTALGFDLTGTWHVSGLSIPRGHVATHDTAGVVTSLSGNNAFDANDGALSIDAAGNVTGSVGGPVTGNAAVGSDGVVSMTLNTPDPITLTCHMNTSSDLMLSSMTGMDSSELLVFAKAPGDALLADAVGTWWVVTLETPASLNANFNVDGKMIGFSNPTTSFISRNTLVIDTEGNYNYNSGEDTGVVAVTSDGTMTLTPSDPQASVMQLHMNALKDVMVTAMAEAGQRSFTILVKSAAVRNWEAAGHWEFDRLSVPTGLSLSYNLDSLVTNIDGLNFFGQENGAIDFTLDGALTGLMEGSFGGYSTGSGNGLINIYHGDPAPFAPAMSIGGDFFVGIEGGGSGNELSILIGVRSVRPLAIGAFTGVKPTIRWVPGAGRTLQETSNAVDWQTVVGSNAMSSYTTNPAIDGSRHFYRLVQP